MRTLFFVVIALAALWSGYWWAGATAKKAAIEGWLEERRAAGWVAETSDVTVQGFPNRFDTTFERLDLADPIEGWSWSAPMFQILGLSYQPNRVIAVWPERQTVSSPQGRIDVRSGVFRGSVAVAPSLSLALDRATIEIEDLLLEGSTGWSATLVRGQVSTRRSPEGTAPDHAYDFYFGADTLRLPEPVKDVLDRAGVLPDVVEKADVDLTAAFDAPWDKHAVEGPQPRLTAMSLKTLDVTWGELGLVARGQFDVDAAGYPNGSIDIEARNWDDMLELAADAGLIPDQVRTPLRRGLGFLAATSGDPSTLRVTLNMEGGRASLGPIPIGRIRPFY